MMPMPQSPPPPPADDERTLTLLLKAIDSLGAAERTEVLMFLLRRGVGVAPVAEPALFTSVGSSVQGPGPGPGQGGGRPGGRPEHPKPDSLTGAMRVSALINPVSFSRPTGEGQQMVPVRFSADSHQRLRAWCGENGFPMAAVVRGLVDQFLEAQG